MRRRQFVPQRHYIRNKVINSNVATVNDGNYKILNNNKFPFPPSGGHLPVGIPVTAHIPRFPKPLVPRTRQQVERFDGGNYVRIIQRPIYPNRFVPPNRFVRHPVYYYPQTEFLTPGTKQLMRWIACMFLITLTFWMME